MYQSPKNRSLESQPSSQEQFTPTKQQLIHDLTLKQILNPMVFCLWQLKITPPNLKISQYEETQFKLKRSPATLCLKKFKNQEPVIECIDCRIGDSSAMCEQCFKHSNHQGHKYIINAASEGCCDCGDENSWRKQGFCKQHTGIFQEIQIPLQQQEKFVKAYQQFFIVYYLKVEQSKNKKIKKSDVQRYLNAILQRLIELNTKSLYYNKLTSNLFTHIIPQENLLTPKNYNKYSILANLMRYQNQQKSELTKQLFFIMLAYPLFKQLLCSYYFEYFHLLNNGYPESSFLSGSLSCQLLSNQKLVKAYLIQQQAYEIGYNTTITNKMFEQVGNISLTIFRDIKNLAQSSTENALIYWKINVKRGIQNLFMYYEKAKYKMESILQNSSTGIQAYKTIPDLLECFQIQVVFVQLMCHTLYKIKSDEKLLIQFLYKLYLKIVQQNKIKIGQLVYKPYQRAFIIVLFSYFKLNLNNITDDSVKQLLQKFRQIGYQVQQNKFRKNLQGALTTIFNIVYNSIKIFRDTQLFIIFFKFIYSYCIKNQILLFIDVIGVKMLILLLKRCPIIDYTSLINLQGRHISQKLNFITFTQIIDGLNKIFFSNCYEAYVAKNIDKDCKIYEQQIENIFIDIASQTKTGLLKKDMHKLEQFINPFFLKDLLRKLCIKNKTGDKFLLKQQFQKSNKIHHKLSDFYYIRNKEQINNQQLQRMFILIRGYNISIFRTLWRQKQIKQLLQQFQQLHNILQNRSQIRFQINNHLFQQIVNCTFAQLMLLKKLGGINEIQFYYEKFVQNASVKANINANYEKFFKNILEQEQKISKQALNRQKIEAVKQAKMDQMRKKQKNVIEKMQIKSQDNINFDHQNQSSECFICKQSSSDSLVYLIKVTVANFDKLFHKNTGYGIECLSFKTCYHVFHAGCVYKSQPQRRQLIKCPLCSQKFNYALPISEKIDKKQPYIKALEIIMFSLKDYQQLDIIQQIIKSFYHFVLLAISDWQYTIAKLLPLYKSVLAFIEKFCEPKDAKRLKKKVKDKSWTLIPKTINQRKSSQHITHNRQIQTNALFIATFSAIIDIITHKKKEAIKLQTITNQNHRKIAKKIIQALSNKQLNDQLLQQNPSKNRQFRLRSLPSKFTSLGQYHTCSQCKRINPTLFLCLLCQNWVGCVKCKDKNSNLNIHNTKYHGSAGAFMDLKNAIAVYFHGQKMNIVGQLYEDESLQPFNIKKCLGNYCLKEQMIQEIEKKILHEEVEEAIQQQQQY